MHDAHRSTEVAARSEGFTLVDLILVMTIMAILAVAAVPSLHSDELPVEARARALVADLRQAQELAIESRRAFGLRFVPGDNRYYFILDGGQTPAAAEVALRADPNLSNVEVERLLEARAGGDPRLEGVALLAAVFGGGSDLIFDADGAPRDTGLVDLARGTFQLRVRVQAGTGRIALTQP